VATLFIIILAKFTTIQGVKMGLAFKQAWVFLAIFLFSMGAEASIRCSPTFKDG